MAPGGPKLAHKTPAQTKNSLFGPGPEIFLSSGPKFFPKKIFFQKNIKCVPKGSGGLKNPNLALGTPGGPILAQNGQNRQKGPKMAQNHPKMTFLTFKVFILKMTAILP